jgi:hypothetical protein
MTTSNLVPVHPNIRARRAANTRIQQVDELFDRLGDEDAERAGQSVDQLLFGRIHLHRLAADGVNVVTVRILDENVEQETLTIVTSNLREDRVLSVAYTVRVGSGRHELAVPPGSGMWLLASRAALLAL